MKLTDKEDILREVKDCVKSIQGEVVNYGYRVDKPDTIGVIVEDINDCYLDELQGEIDSWGNIPVKYIGNTNNELVFKVLL